ncbi:hypothetical protein NP493_627g00038 [Ridgeia piscesae]|uniref:Uncharacterized protein n=1 Tax=Ridgeia piscesae TaxID=27915 RepID=A0AAD9KTD9_RIDPI|nr:hypothetical protein NP493_627g00038 [Ridgeia piscesae]
MAAPIDKLFVREFERKDGSILTINQSEVGDVGCVVWDAAIVLSCYMETSDFYDVNANKNILAGKRVIELGAGTGLVGLQAACLGAKCTVTDLSEFIPLMQLNIDANRHMVKTGSITAQTLKWGSDIVSFLPAPDYILLADCIYYPQSLEPLVDTVVKLSSSRTITLCCYEERTTGNKPELEKNFFKLIHESFTVEEIPLSRQDVTYRSPDIHIMRFTLR